MNPPPDEPLDWTPRPTPLGPPAAPATGPAWYPGPPPPSSHPRTGQRRLVVGLSVAIAAATLISAGLIVAALALRGDSAAAPSPTCDVIGIDGCTSKGADGGPIVVPVTSTPVAPTTSPVPPPPPPPPPVPTIEEGTWTVGQDFPPGTYRTTATADPSCYWAITKSGSNGNDIISNANGGGRLTVALKNGQDFTTHRCGTWGKVG